MNVALELELDIISEKRSFVGSLSLKADSVAIIIKEVKKISREIPATNSDDNLEIRK